MSAGMIIYFVALGILDLAFLLGTVYMIKCYKPDPGDDDEGAGFILLVTGIGFIITSIVIANAGHALAAPS